MVTSDLANDKDIPLDVLLSDKDIPGEPPFRAYIEAKVYDKEGHIIQYHRQPMKSLTEYFLALLTIPLVGTYQNGFTNQAPPIFTNITGIPGQISSGIGIMIYWIASIQVGSGTQSFSLTLNGLAAPIPNGTGAEELQYGTVSVTYTATTIFFSITVTNSSGSTINVTEIGLFGKIAWVNYSSTYTFLLSYDTFSPAISIPNGALATFQITITFSG
jgi:hypothetical protein